MLILVASEQIPANKKEIELTPREIIDAVTTKFPGADAGCALTLQEENTGSFYVMWTTPLVPQNIHKLAVAATSQERLEVHWVGFIEERQPK